MDEPYISDMTYYRVHDEEGEIIFETEIESSANKFLQEYMKKLEGSGFESDN